MRSHIIYIMMHINITEERKTVCTTRDDMKDIYRNLILCKLTPKRL
jgi:hypothetical protein